jgi:hypothetical protein
MATREELLSLFGDDFDEVLKGLNALPVEVRQLLDRSLNNLVYDAEVFGQRINKVVQTQQARGIALSNIAGSLATDMQNKGRIFGELKNSIKSSLVEGVNQAGQAGSFAAYDPDENTVFTWITVAGHKICADCAPRGGQQGTLREWEERGMPGSGWSVCQGYCYCILDPSGKLSPRIQFEEVQEQGATARPTPSTAPLPAPPVTPPKKVSASNKALQKKGLRSENLSTQQRLENLLQDDDLPDHLKKYVSDEPTGFGSYIVKKHGKINFKGVNQANLKIIADALEDTLGRYNLKVNYLGTFTRSLRARKANAAAWGRGESKTSGNFLMGWKKDYIAKAKKNQPLRRLNWVNNKEYIARRLKITLDDLKDAQKKGIAGLENRIVELEDQYKLYTNKNFNKWSTSSVADDPLYATTKHEAWHQIDYQLSDKPLTGMKKGGDGGLFGQKLKKYKVDREQWYEVSEYAHHNIHELWAETGTALDLGFFVPENIKKAFIETIEAAGHSYP